MGSGMGSGLGSGFVAFKVQLPWDRKPSVLRVDRDNVQHAQQILLARQQKMHGESAEVSAVYIDGVKADVVFNRVPQEHIGCCAVWRDSAPQVAIPPSMRQLGTRVEKTEMRAMSLSQLQELDDLARTLLNTPRSELTDRDGQVATYDGEASGMSALDMYTINEFIVKPLTRPFRSSFMELLSTCAQPPAVFMSHAWSTAWKQTIKLLKFYAQQRFPAVALVEVYIWICTFANNQHDLGELTGGLMDTPFARAIRSKECVGTVVLLDKDITPFKRVWCVLEAWVSLEQREARAHGEGYSYDFLASSGGQATALLDAGAGQAPREVSEMRLYTFPGTIAEAGMQITIEAAQASREDDRRQIMKHVRASDGGSAGLDRQVRAWFVSRAAIRFAEEGKASVLEEMLEEWPLEAVMRGDRKGWTPVGAVAEYGHAACLELLLCARADPAQADIHGWAPVRVAAGFGHTACLQLLLGARADPAQADNDGYTPVWVAASQGHAASLELLFGARADLVQADVGTTPILAAAREGHLACLQLLLGARACPAQADNDGRTPAAVADRYGHREFVELLVAAGAPQP